MNPELTLLTTSEVAERAKVDAATVRRWVERGQLVPAVTTPGGHYRFASEDVARLLRPKAAS